MITFLNCDAEAYYNLRFNLTYQTKEGIKNKCIEVKGDSDYKISFADNDYGLVTHTCKIIGYTMCMKEDPKAFVSKKTKPFVVDTIKIDCSEDGCSKIYDLNVCDIRYIEEYSSNGFNEIVMPVKHFK